MVWLKLSCVCGLMVWLKIMAEALACVWLNGMAEALACVWLNDMALKHSRGMAALGRARMVWPWHHAVWRCQKQAKPRVVVF